MRGRKLRCVVAMAAALIAVTCALSLEANTQVQYAIKVLHGFTLNSSDGNGPEGPVVFDGQGNLYGATLGGGGGQCAGGCGTIFELSPVAAGEWLETILYNFSGGSADGFGPSGLVGDEAGNLYGATVAGGLNSEGTLFELSPGSDGQWMENILYNFCSLPNCADGGGPTFPPTLNPAGGLYGVTPGSRGTAYKLTPGSNGWNFSLLYTFCSQGDCGDGAWPFGSMALDGKGNLYGETEEGGDCDNLSCGVVFTLRSQASAPWPEVVLYAFNPENHQAGSTVSGGVTLHQDDIFTGTQFGGDTAACNGGGCGTVLELTRDPSASTKAREEIVHDFGPNVAQGIYPIAAVEFDHRGNLFGVTNSGGSPSCECGTVYGMKPQGNGKWGFAVLHAFVGTDGSVPTSALTLDEKGNIYGTTQSGGPGEGGVAFELSPVNTAWK